MKTQKPKMKFIDVPMGYEVNGKNKDGYYRRESEHHGIQVICVGPMLYTPGEVEKALGGVVLENVEVLQPIHSEGAQQRRDLLRRCFITMEFTRL